MENKLIKIANYYNNFDVELAKLKLEENDIYCFRIDSFKFFIKEDNELTLTYSSILQGNITIGRGLVSDYY